MLLVFVVCFPVRIVETQYWIQKCCKIAFLSGAREFLQWCIQCCLDDLRSVLSSHRNGLLRRLACESTPLDFHKYGIQMDKLDEDHDMWLAQGKFGFSNEITRKKLSEKVHARKDA